MVLVSGGRASAMMAFHIHNAEKYNNFNKLYVYTNTGMEKKETIDFLKSIKNVWGIPLILLEGVYSTEKGIGVKSKIVNFDNLDMNGVVFSNMISQMNKYKNIGVPNQAVPYCSDYLKTRVAHDFARNYFGTTSYIKALGFRKEDMPKRITLLELSMDSKKICPLLTDFTQPLGNLDLNDFFSKQPFKLELHSKYGNCELCWKKDTKLLLESIQLSTKFVSWHQQKEKEYGNMFFRNNKSIDYLVQLSKNNTQAVLFDDEAFDGCVCEF